MTRCRVNLSPPYLVPMILVWSGMIIFAAFLMTGDLSAELTSAGPMEPIRVKTLETTEGTVAYVSTSHISIAYKQTANAEYEMYLPVDQEVKLEYYFKMSDIKAGDLVKLQYEKIVESPGEPNERITKTVKKIRLVKKATKEGEA